MTEEEVRLLLSARGADMEAVVGAADRLRQLVCGDEVTYVVNRWDGDGGGGRGGDVCSVGGWNWLSWLVWR